MPALLDRLLRRERPVESTSRLVVQCNLLDAKGQPPRGYLMNPNLGNVADSIQVVLRRNDGSWSAYWSRIDRFGNFRVKTLPEQHPRHGDERIMDFPTREDAEEMVQLLERAHRAAVAARSPG